MKKISTRHAGSLLPYESPRAAARRLDGATAASPATTLPGKLRGVLLREFAEHMLDARRDRLDDKIAEANRQYSLVDGTWSFDHAAERRSRHSVRQ